MSEQRFKDRHLAIVSEWKSGCLLCGEEATGRSLPQSGGLLDMPLCQKHTRWAMASRRERVGKQARDLRLYLLAWCRLKGGDRERALTWLRGEPLKGSG